MGNCLSSLLEFVSGVNHNDQSSTSQAGHPTLGIHSNQRRRSARDEMFTNEQLFCNPNSSFTNAVWLNDPLQDNWAGDADLSLVQQSQLTNACSARLENMLEQIPAETYVKASKRDVECAICMIEFENGDMIRYLPCMHCYHMKCVDDWLMRSFTCPSCLEPVDSAILSSFAAGTANTLSDISCSIAEASSHSKTPFSE